MVSKLDAPMTTGYLMSLKSNTNIIEKYRESRSGSVALDISEAIEQVWHQGILNKLPGLNCPRSLAVGSNLKAVFVYSE